MDAPVDDSFELQPAEVELDLVERFTGQVRLRTVNAARAELDAAGTLLASDLQKLSHAVEARRLAEVKLRSARLRRLISRWPGRFDLDPWIIASILAVMFGLVAGVAGIVVFRAPLWLVLPVAVGAPGVFFVATPWFFANLHRQGEQIDRLASVHAARIAAAAEADAAVKLSRQRQSAARAVYEGLVKANEFPLNRLLATDAGALTPAAFELHVAEVFAFLGFHVRRVNLGDDQGVDLILWKNQDRVAVQTRPGLEPVDQSAVQSAFSGMVFHHCGSCVVVTHGEFTPAAKALARATGCTLIDGVRRAELIRGAITV